jgi:hypothetical protein
MGCIYCLSERGRRENVSCQYSQGMLIFSDIDSGSIEGNYNFVFKGELHTDNQNSIANLTLAFLSLHRAFYRLSITQHQQMHLL